MAQTETLVRNTFRRLLKKLVEAETGVSIDRMIERKSTWTIIWNGPDPKLSAEKFKQIVKQARADTETALLK